MSAAGLAQNQLDNGSTAEAAAWNQLSIDYHAALGDGLDGFQAANAGVTLFRLDLAGLLNGLIKADAERGFANTTTPAAPGLDPGESGYDLGQVTADDYTLWRSAYGSTADLADDGDRAGRARPNRPRDHGDCAGVAYRLDAAGVETTPVEPPTNGRFVGVHASACFAV